MRLHLLVCGIVLYHKRVYTDGFNRTVVLQFNLLFYYIAIHALLKAGTVHDVF